MIDNIPLSELTIQALEDLKREFELAMSYDELLIVRNYYMDKQYDSISPSTLKVLDAIAADAKKNAKNVCITELGTDNKDAFETYVDMVSKQSIITRRHNAPLALSDAANVANEYTKITRKRTPQLLSMSELYTEDGAPVFPMSDEFCKLNLKLANATAFVLVSPAEAMSRASYLRAVENFVSCEGLSDKIILARKISHGGILSALAEISSGVLVDVSSIPDMPEYPELLHLVSEHRGKFILAIQKSYIEFSSAIAEYYGLSLSYFAKVIGGEQLVFVPANNIGDTVDLPLVRKLSTTSVAMCAKIAEERLDNIDTLPVHFEPRRSGEARANTYGTIYLRNNSVSTVCASSLENAPFYASLGCALSATLPIIASGVSRDDISLKLRYTLPDTVTDESIGQSVAAMLGVYRVMSELYLSGESSLEYTNSTSPSLAVAAFSSSKNAKILKKLIKKDSGVYLLSFDRSECGIPSFESFRAMCDFYLGCVKNKYVLSAAAVNGSITDTLAAMRSDFECKTADSAEPFLSESALGIIVESEIPLDHGVFLGTTVYSIDTI